IDDTHVYWNLNTEYEIFSLEGSRGRQGELVQGAIMFLGHQKPFTQTCPPIGPIAAEARRQGAIIDWDKHNWPWSAMLVPVAGIETIELSNNHMWRLTPFVFSRFGEPAPDWMNRSFDNRGWAEFGFQTYYALLNSGFFIRAGAGTANGVHPVPLGFSRVYVKIDGPFSYQKWLEGLKKGRSFTTNGPMLFLTVDHMLPGDRKKIPAGQNTKVRINLKAQSVNHLENIEIIVNGRVVHTFDCSKTENRTHCAYNHTIDIKGTSWIAARCFEIPPKDNVRFAHTGPVFFDDPTQSLLPERRQIEFFLDSVHRAIERYGDKLSPAARAEYQKALQAYRAAAKTGINSQAKP
ncbi:MAG: CehA/McbA family metallohydrolase, partial [Planctomycetota bacterium]